MLALTMAVVLILQVIGALRKEHHTPISYIALDWHEMDKQLGHEGIVEAFWQTVSACTCACCCTCSCKQLWLEAFW